MFIQIKTLIKNVFDLILTLQSDVVVTNLLRNSTKRFYLSIASFKFMILKHRLKALIVGSIGNLVEWYDWYAYAAFALYFAPVFFAKDNPTAQLLNTAAIFAVGFLMRPIGGWLLVKLPIKEAVK